MQTAHHSGDILAHFNRLSADQPAVPLHAETEPSRYTRGIGWVLQWFAALAVFSFAIVLLTSFFYCLAAERALARAARAGAMEATLPRATKQSVSESVQRRLMAYGEQLSRCLRITVAQNGAPVQNVIFARGGDQFTISVAMPARAALPGWLQTIAFWHGDSPIEAHAARDVPGRALAGL